MPIAIALVAVAVLSVILAGLYAEGIVNWFTTVKPHHYTHAFVLVVVAVACLVGANFARPKPAN